jgi:hypothetical protein
MFGDRRVAGNMESLRGFRNVAYCGNRRTYRQVSESKTRSGCLNGPLQKREERRCVKEKKKREEK